MKIKSNVDLLSRVQKSNVGTYLPDDVTKIVVNIVLQRSEHKVLTINSFNSWFYWIKSIEGLDYWGDKFRYLQDRIYEDKI